MNFELLSSYMCKFIVSGCRQTNRQTDYRQNDLQTKRLSSNPCCASGHGVLTTAIVTDTLTNNVD